MVEDDEETAETLRWGLAEVGIPADVVHNGGEAIARSQANAYDVVLLDVMLPDGPDGFAVCRRLRELRVPSRVMMLTARTGVSDRVSGLDSGADDYLAKPFAFAELLARIRALSRRDRAPASLAFSDLAVDELTRVASVGANHIALTRKEFDLLALLAQHAGRVVAEEHLLDRGWSFESTPTAGLVDVYMSRLRRKLAGAGSRVRIVNLRGVGYRLEVGDA